MQITNNYSVLTPGLTGGDVVKTGNILQVTGMPALDIRLIVNCGSGHVIAPQAETLAVWTVQSPATPTASATYGYLLRQQIPFVIPSFTGIPAVPGTNTVFATNIHTVTPGGETANAMMLAIEKGALRYTQPNAGFQFTSSVTTDTETLTAKAGYPLLEVMQASVPPGNLTIVNTVPGVASIGTVNDLIRLGVSSALLTTGHVYGEVIFNYAMIESGGNDFPALTASWQLFIDKTANTTNYTNFVNALIAAIPNLLS